MRWLVVLCAVAACARTSSIQCADGRVCPAGTACDDSHQLCVLDEQLEACTDKDDGAECTFGAQLGVCDAGVCLAIGCGNGFIEGDEACDDGNIESGDGCRGDCRKVELCGDRVRDEGEACDDANDNAADGCDACTANVWRATAVIAGGTDPLQVALGYPEDVAVDRDGNVYISDTFHHRVLRLDRGGALTTVAGTGFGGFSGDRGAATAAQLFRPAGIAIDGLGNLYIADRSNNRIRRVDANGIITTIAGIGLAGTTGDGSPATVARLNSPSGVAVDGLGNVYIADTSNQRIRRIDTSGVITTVAGTGDVGGTGDGGMATSAQLNNPRNVAVDDSGTLFIADTYNARIRKVSSGIITTVAGSLGGFGGDGGPATAATLNSPTDVTIDDAGNLYVADDNNQRIRRVSTNGTITTVAGTGVAGHTGDGGLATTAQLHSPQGVAVAPDGTLYIASTRTFRIRRVDAAGAIATVAGTGEDNDSGDGGSATATLVALPSRVAVDSNGNVYFAEQQTSRIRRIDTAGILSTVAGTGTAGYSGDGGSAVAAQLSLPDGIAFDGSGNLYIADTGNQRIRRIDAQGVITSIAGTGTFGFDGDGAAATAATFANPSDIAFDSLGNLYIADTGNNRIRRVDTTGTITTVAGTGTAADGGDGGPAIAANLDIPQGVAVDGQRNVYIADRGNHRIRKIDTTGTITSVAGTGTNGYTGDGGSATAATLGTPGDVVVDGAGNLYIAELANNVIRRVSAGTITTYAGTGTYGMIGDGGSPTAAELATPSGVAVDALGNVYVADLNNRRIRRIEPTRITTIAGAIDPAGTGPAVRARLADPRALVLAPAFTLFAGGSSGTVEALLPSGRLEVVAGRYLHPAPTGTLARFRASSFGRVGGVAYDEQAGIIYLTESNKIHAVTIVDPADPKTWTIATLTGDTAGYADGPLSGARFRAPTGLYLDAVARELYVADTGNHAIRAIDLTAGTATTIAGIGETRGYFGDDAAATSALLFAPQAITRCANGDLFVADTGNHRVRRIAAGTISSVLGDGTGASSGEGAPSSLLPVSEPLGLACDATGNLFVTSSTTLRLVAADSTGHVDGSGTVYTIYGQPPRDEFPASATSCLTGLAVVDDTTLRIVDACAGLLVELHREAVTP